MSVCSENCWNGLKTEAYERFFHIVTCRHPENRAAAGLESEMSDKLTILAVDDNSINLATIEQELRNKYEVVTVNSGARAVRYLNKEKPDLILLDVQMALMDGIETLKEIRTMENGAAIPVMMLTSKKDRETVLEGTKLGILDYVLKPFEGKDLMARIEKALKRAGTIPVEDAELYADVKNVQEDIQSGNVKNAILKCDEIASLKIDEEILGRIKNARTRLRMEEVPTAERLIARVLKILEKSVKGVSAVKSPINVTEMNARLLHVLSDLKEYKVRDASQKLEELMQYEIPDNVKEICVSAQEYLDEFDDGAAEELIQKALNELRNSLI